METGFKVTNFFKHRICCFRCFYNNNVIKVGLSTDPRMIRQIRSNYLALRPSVSFSFISFVNVMAGIKSGIFHDQTIKIV